MKAARMKFDLAAVFSFIGGVGIFAQTNVLLPTIPANTFYATNYGAVGDGVTTNTTAIQAAITAASAAGGGSVIITPGNYLCGPITLANSINLQINTNATLTMLPIDQYPGGDVSPANFISASTRHDIQISGGGGIEGLGLPWWKDSETNAAAVRPNMVNFSACSKILIQDITCSNSPSPFIVIKGKAGNVTMQRVKIFAPSSGAAVNPSHNTDALDLAETNAIIRDCTISTGDDNIAIGSSASPSFGILVTNCAFGDGHGCSIGSYTSGGVSNLTVINCSFNGTDNGIRLKSERGRGSTVNNLNYLNLTMTNVPWPLLIYSYYEFGLGSLTGVNPDTAANVAITNYTPFTNNLTPAWRDITFSNITATTGASTRPPLMIWGLPEAVVSNVVFQKLSLTSSSTLSPGIYNATNIQFIDCSFSLVSTTTNFQLFNAELIITNSTLATNLIKLDGLTTNTFLNELSLFNASASLRDTNTFTGGPHTLAAATLNITNHFKPAHATPFNFTLGTNAATIAVRSNLVFDGTFSFAAGAGFTNGNYTIFTYGGSLGWAAPTIATAPTNSNYAFDTNTAGQIKLVASKPSPPRFTLATLSSTQLVISGTSGYTNGSYNFYVITSTNISLPTSNWSRAATNPFDPAGNFAFTNTITASIPAKFFKLLLP